MVLVVASRVVVKVLGNVVVVVVGNSVVVCGSSVVVSNRVADLVVGVAVVAVVVAMEGRTGRVADRYLSRSFLSMATSHTKGQPQWSLVQ